MSAQPAARGMARAPLAEVRRDVTIAALLGALMSVVFVHTWAWPLALACPAWLAWRVAAASPRRAAALGFAFAAAWLAAGTWWLFISMHRYGGLAAPLAALAVATLAALLAVYLALAMAAAASWRSGRPLHDALLFAVLWLATELARGLLFTGFPWVASGYAFIDSPLAALAPWVGVYGIGFIAAWLAALAAQLARAASGERLQAVVALAGTAALVGAAALGGPFSAPAGRMTVSLIQTDVAQDEKFSTLHLPQAMEWLAQALQQTRGELTIAPETAIPLLPAQLDPAYWQRVASPFRDGRRAALIGLPLGSYEAGYTNSVAGLTLESAALPGGFYRYDKQHLVPFGEFVPYGFRWFVDMMNIPLGDFSRGPLAAPSFEMRQTEGTLQRIAPNICYEDLFGEELAVRFADAASAPTVLANVSNIGWFGDTIAVAQQLNISRMRALEFERPMLRATNTGATAVIDHRGRAAASLPPFTRGVLESEVQGRSGATPFARWAATFGLWPLIAMAAVVTASAALRSRRRNNAAP